MEINTMRNKSHQNTETRRTQRTLKSNTRVCKGGEKSKWK